MTPGWVPIPVDYLPLVALTPGLKNTFWAICSFAFGDHTGCYPSQAAIAKRAGCSGWTVKLHIRRLASLGLVQVIRRGRRNYYLLPHKAKGMAWADSIRECVASLPPDVHVYKSLKQFLAEERGKARFTDRELRRVREDMRTWADESDEAEVTGKTV
jgi:biotin operon repressor